MKLKHVVQSALQRFDYNLRRIDAADERAGIRILNRELVKTNTHQRRSAYIRRINSLPQGRRKAHYGCGRTLLKDDWINLDLPRGVVARHDEIYLSVNLVGVHPFSDQFLDFGYSEDFLEHLDQAQSIMFLSELYRTMRSGGTSRLVFPGLRQVLSEHFRTSDHAGASAGVEEAYRMWDHRHFYSEEELASVASHIGFCHVSFHAFGMSSRPELANLDHRSNQSALNIYAELTK